MVTNHEMREHLNQLLEFKLQPALDWARKYAKGNKLTELNSGQLAVLYYIYEMLSEDYGNHERSFRHVIYPLANRKGCSYTDWLIEDFEFKYGDMLKLVSNEESVKGSLHRTVNIAQINDKYMLLHMAAEEGEIGSIKYILKAGVNIDKRNDKGESALHMAAAKGVHASIVYLVEKGANIFALDIDRNVPFHKAIEKLCFPIDTKMLSPLGPKLFAGKRKKMADGSHTTLIHKAAECGDINTFRYLLPYSDLESLDSKGFTPLHIAVNNNYPNLVKLVIHYLGEWRTIDKLSNAEGLVELAQNKNYSEIVEILKATE